jgi:phosphohistidine swiveling domain-containing protein/glycerol-3-phosphate acyltransferase PlsY
MSLTQVWGLLLIFILCPILGGLPLIRWITTTFTRKDLAQLGTGNLSVSAAFYHGGRSIGILAVLSEAAKGIAAVLLARYFFPADPVWEIVALIALVMGRYWMGRGAGTTNVVWGYVVHDWIGAGLIFLISGVLFTLLRERRSGRLGVLFIIVLITALRHPQDSARVSATVLLCGLIAWIYQKIPDDLDLPAETAKGSSQTMFKFFRGDRALLSLAQPLPAAKVGNKAATLSHLAATYPIPPGWVLPAGDDPAPLISYLDPSIDAPLIVRSSAIGEDSEFASAAGQYESIAHITSRARLEQAILRCQESYDRPHAVQYRQDQGLADQSMAVLVQVQVQGVYSGVAFSRDPMTRQGDVVAIEALPGMASRVVSGQETPEQYRVEVNLSPRDYPDWRLPDEIELSVQGTVQGTGKIPARLIQQVAFLARHLEEHYHGVPQDVEWSYDGEQLWVLQSRPITTLLPIWTRKIAAEVIPGFIHPLTWSVNRPLTCGVWGDIFTIVLGKRAQGMDFTETATLHHAAAYFNASLLGQIFRQMGLPAESLEFLTRGAKFNKPPIASTLGNLPGLLRLLRREMRLEKDFHRDNAQYFAPGFVDLEPPVEQLSAAQLLRRIDQILALLKRATYYSILAPLSLALRQAISKTKDAELDYQVLPEVASLRSLQSLAASATIRPTQFSQLAETPEGQALLQQFDRLLQQYGYLSQVATDISVPRWRDNPQMVQDLFMHSLGQPAPEPRPSKPGKAQRRLALKGQVTTVYSRLLAELRWSFVALENIGLAEGLLQAPGDIFFLKLDEIRQIDAFKDRLSSLISDRRAQLERDRQATPPWLVYGNDPPFLDAIAPSIAPTFQGIGASPGQIEGAVLVVKNLQSLPEINKNTILVVPYTDSGWSPLLARAGGLIAEVGGQLSHGAIVAREYGIPAVMNISDATRSLQNGDRVRVDGSLGRVERL